MRLAGSGEFGKADATFALEADVDHGLVAFDPGDGALDDAAFEAAVGCIAESLVEERFEIGARGVCRRGHKLKFPN